MGTGPGTKRAFPFGDVKQNCRLLNDESDAAQRPPRIRRRQSRVLLLVLVGGVIQLVILHPIVILCDAFISPLQQQQPQQRLHDHHLRFPVHGILPPLIQRSATTPSVQSSSDEFSAADFQISKTNTTATTASSSSSTTPEESISSSSSSADVIPASSFVRTSRTIASSSSSSSSPQLTRRRREMELMWCDANVCKDDLRERATKGGRIVMRGPATGQVAYHWTEMNSLSTSATKTASTTTHDGGTTTQYVLFLVKQGSDVDALLTICADAVQQLSTKHGPTNLGILLDPTTAARLQHYHGVAGSNIHLFEPLPCKGYGNNVHPDDVAATEFGNSEISSLLPPSSSGSSSSTGISSTTTAHHRSPAPNLIVTIGGDGLLMYAGMLFQGPMPPILCVAGGSLGFLTAFSPAEMVPAIELALGLVSAPSELPTNPSDLDSSLDLQVFPPNMIGYPYDDTDTNINTYRNANNLNNNNNVPDAQQEQQRRYNFPFGIGDYICLSIRMRLDCRIITRDGAIKARYNVLNEVVVDRGSSPYLAALECFCDDAHLTTVQADGVIFATPTGSTAYSLAAGSSVVHPAVPCILVTPICPHVLSFRSMVFPDHVVLRCYVPHDARADASVAFDGKHRQELHRGDSVQIQMSAHPVPTINRKDHSADWLGSLKRSFNFNSRPRQRPL